jgi:hypothetical protein
LVVVHDHRSRQPAGGSTYSPPRGLFLATTEDFDMAMDSRLQPAHQGHNEPSRCGHRKPCRSQLRRVARNSSTVRNDPHAYAFSNLRADSAWISKHSHRIKPGAAWPLNVRQVASADEGGRILYTMAAAIAASWLEIAARSRRRRSRSETRTRSMNRFCAAVMIHPGSTSTRVPLRTWRTEATNAS